jgi:hypothetical protein
MEVVIRSPSPEHKKVMATNRQAFSGEFSMSKRLGIWLLSLFASMGFGPGPYAGAAGQCDPVAVSIRPLDGERYGARFGQLELFAEQTSVSSGHTIHPDGFLLKNLQTGTTCQADEGITDSVYLSVDQKHLIFLSGSGSMSDVRSVSVQDCGEIGHLSVFTPRIEVAQNQIKVDPGCECTSKDESRCQCSPGGVYDLGNDCRFRRLEKASQDQAKKLLGVAISEET